MPPYSQTLSANPRCRLSYRTAFSALNALEMLRAVACLKPIVISLWQEIDSSLNLLLRSPSFIPLRIRFTSHLLPDAQTPSLFFPTLTAPSQYFFTFPLLPSTLTAELYPHCSRSSLTRDQLICCQRAFNECLKEEGNPFHLFYFPRDDYSLDTVGKASDAGTV
ncbi:unnamed protein product [Hydatigera taeniaeformis]|uniref:Uncharacterized protein n=1 Tax=Hydatigena taeniaeformis TaxID=6205 RepID=A0A0R3WP72_HYDTA|nr:unnamed protein product [Hydatigera taeniaeformis]